MWSSILEQLSSAGDIPWEVLHDYRFTSVPHSQESNYLNVCKIILMKIDQSSLLVDDREGLLEEIILKKKLSVLPVICNQLYLCDIQSYRRDKLVDLLVKFISRKNHLEGALLQISTKGVVSSSQLEISELIHCLINIPSSVANKMQLKTPSVLFPVNYFNRLCQAIFHCLSKIHERLKHGSDTSIEFICCIVGRISSSGYPDIVWKSIIKLIIDRCQDDFIWRRIGHHLVTKQNDRDLEGIVRPILMNSENPDQVKWILRDSPSSRDKLKYLLTVKFVLIHYSEKHQFIINLIGYLANISDDLFYKVTDNLLVAWSNGSALKHRPLEQQIYICSGLAVSAKYLERKELSKPYRDKLIQNIIYAIEVYLSSVLPEIRFTGLYIGQLMLTVLQKDDTPKLDLQIEQIPEVVKLMALYGSEFPKMSEENKEMTDIDELAGEVANNKITEDNDEENEEDDDLIPYDMSNDTPLDKTKKPIYISDCINGLQDSENIDWFKICLESASEIIDKNRSMISDYSEDFARTLLFLQDNYELPNFISFRRDALVKLTVVDPIPVAIYLTGQFYDTNLVISHRCDILEVLSTASQELSKPLKAKNETEETSSQAMFNQIVGKMVPNDVVIAEKKWKTVVEDRISAKTKIFSKSKSKPKITINRFASIAGYFFFPLMQHHDSSDITFNLMGDDFYLLGRLLYTLGIILDSASQAPITQKMGKSLIDFLWTFRYHVESFVRQAIIFDLCIVLTAIPKTYIMESMQSEIIEFQKWLLDITEKDTDKECVERAFQALFLLKQLVESVEENFSTFSQVFEVIIFVKMTATNRTLR